MLTKPKLILSLTSPYARKVRIFAIEKGIDFDVAIDVPWNEDTQVTNFNPLGKVPVWITTENEAWFDSRVIVEYLDMIPSGPTLISDQPKERISIKKLEAVADGIMDASLVLFAERKKRPQELQHPWWIDRQFGKIHRGLSALSEELGSKDFLLGQRLTLADIATICALDYIGLRFADDFSWKERYPNLLRFHSLHSQKPSFHKTIPVV